MLIMDMPNVPPQTAPVLMQVTSVSPKTPDKLNSDKLEGTMGACVVSPTLSKMGSWINSSLPNGIPLHPQETALRRIAKDDNLAMLDTALHSSVQILQQPKHGAILQKNGGFGYLPTEGYVGNDKVVFLVNIDGHNVKAVYYLRVVDSEINPEDINRFVKKYCPGQDEWVISSTATGGNALANTLAQYYLNSNTMNTVGVTVNFSDLAGGAVGQTVGNTITLDDNAAGNGWFIDTTPSDNSEFLPTSTPNEWVAKQGSTAYGKMDMLSVLLHEYGHALGIEHSADSSDYMAPILTPGVRRLPTADELALMQQLVGQVKSEEIRVRSS